MIAAAAQKRTTRSAPTRTCIGCRKASEASGLVRLTRSPAGEVVVDHPSRLGGRGAWVCACRRCLARATKGGALAKALGGPLETVSAEVLDGRIRERLQSRVDGLLASAGRARKVSIGAAESASAIKGGNARLLLLADDVSARVRGDLSAAAERAGVPVMLYGDRDRLGLTMARSLVGALVVLDGGFASAVGRELELLLRLDGDGAPADRTISSPKGEAEALERAT